jgi:hypothetical protein
MTAILLAAALLFTSEIPFVIDGVAAPGAAVRITIGETSIETAADAGGIWRAEWTAPLATGTYGVEINAAGEVTTRLLRVQLRGRLPRKPNVEAESLLHDGKFIDRGENVELSDRWRIEPPPYELDEHPRAPRIGTRGATLDPYNRNLLKGDLPLRGNDLFLVLTGLSESRAEAREVGGMASQSVVVSADLYRGNTTFQPAQQRVKITLGANLRRVETEEDGTTGGRFSLQELFYEQKLADLTPSYDFLSVRAGAQPFVSDFRGFLLAETAPGLRLFGNHASNRYQYNVALFDRLEKDPVSGLNRMERTGQQVVVANFYWHDFLAAGYSQQFTAAVLRQDRTVSYLGTSGSGHIGRINVDQAAYLALGSSLRATMAAVELSYTRDWLRPRAGLLYASGDDDTLDGKARGFDSIFDAAAFAGGGFSFWSRNAIDGLKQRGSIFPSMRRSAEANFVNPGLRLLSAGADAAVTPRLKAQATVNYLQFDTGGSAGLDLSLGVRYRPFLSNNAVIVAGAAVLSPGNALETLLGDGSTLYHLFTGVVLQF